MSAAAPQGNGAPNWDPARRRLDELTTLIEALTTERQHLRAQLDSIVYPVLTLPPEISSHIFLHAIPTHSKPSSLTAPLLLTQICRQWRAIALATPSLWQSLTLNRGCEQTGYGKLLNMWLERSAALPLTLSFGTLDTQTQSLIDASLIHSHRWKEIAIYSQASIAGSNVSFPILRKVALSLRRPFPRTITLLEAPVLRHASITLDSQSNIQLPWAQLTTLDLETFALAAASCALILSHCSQLSRLSYLANDGRADDTDTFTQPHITLQVLHSLHIRGLGSSIVSFLTLPALKHLTLTDRIASAVRSVQALYFRAPFKLLTLSFIDPTAAWDADVLPLRQFYSIFPTVTEVAIRAGPLKHVADSLATPGAVPLMQHLIIDAVRSLDDFQSLLQVLRARRNTLTSFTLILRPSRDWYCSLNSEAVPKAVKAQLHDIAKDGLKIRVQLLDSMSSTLLDTITY
jgi:hypothetical protein